MEGGCFRGSSSRQLRSSTYVSKQSEMCDEQKNLGIGQSFIKVIGRNISKQVQIPEEFMVKFNGNVPHRFIMESSITKRCWRVEVEEDENGRVCFGEGWTDFVEAHSLKIGDFLVFEHEEQSIFQVKIYGKNGCEKRTFGCTELSPDKPERKIEFEEIEESESDEYEENILENRHGKIRRLSPYRHDVHRKDGVSRTYAKATEVSISENNVSFSTLIHKEKRHQFTRLTIPKAVVLAKKLSSMKEVVLQVSEGNSWSVSLQHSWDTHVLYLCKGWKDFLEDNKVVGGDMLRFEFISDNLIQVHITKTSEVDHPSGDDEVSGLLNMDCDDDEPITCTPDQKAIEASITKKGSSSESKSCSFSFTWSERTSGKYLHIPKLVGEGQNLKNKERVVLRDPEGKCWPLKVTVWFDGRLGLTKGWQEFWKGHGITAGDSLYFEFVSECLIQVTICRGKPLLDHEPAIEGALENLEAIDNDGTNYLPDSPEEVDNTIISQAVEFA